MRLTVPYSLSKYERKRKAETNRTRARGGEGGAISAARRDGGRDLKYLALRAYGIMNNARGRRRRARTVRAALNAGPAAVHDGDGGAPTNRRSTHARTRSLPTCVRIDATSALRSLSLAGDSAVRRQLYMCRQRVPPHACMHDSRRTLRTHAKCARACVSSAPPREGAAVLACGAATHASPARHGVLRGRHTRVQILEVANV